MATIRGCEEASAIGRPSSGRHRAGEPSWIAAHRLAHDDWRAWVVRETDTARRLADATAAGRRNRIEARPRGFAAAVASLRRTIGAVAFDARRRGRDVARRARRRQGGPITADVVVGEDLAVVDRLARRR